MVTLFQPMDCRNGNGKEKMIPDYVSRCSCMTSQRCLINECNGVYVGGAVGCPRITHDFETR